MTLDGCPMIEIFRLKGCLLGSMLIIHKYSTSSRVQKGFKSKYEIVGLQFQKARNAPIVG